MSFKKKFNISKSRGILLNKYDTLLDSFYKLQTVSIDEANGIREFIQQAEFSETQFDELNAILDSYIIYRTIDYEGFNVFKGRMKKIMLWRKSKNQKGYLTNENQVIIASLQEEINSCEHELSIIKNKIENALEKRLKLEWKVLTAKKNLLIKRLTIKNNSLDQLITLSSNLQLSKEIDSVDTVNKHLAKECGSIDIDKLSNIMDESSVLKEELLSASNQLDNIVDQNTNEDDFDQAYEQFLLQKDTRKESDFKMIQTGGVKFK